MHEMETPAPYAVEDLRPLSLPERFEASALREQAGRMPPQATNAEARVLGAILAEPSTLLDVQGRVRAEDFYDRDHRAIYAAMLALSGQGAPMTLDTVREQTQADGAGVGAYFLVNLLTGAVGDAGYYACVVREKAMLREVITLGTKAAGAAYENGDPFDLLDALREGGDAILGALPGKTFTTLAQALELADARVDVPGAPCRLQGLRALLGGWKPGKLYVAAGRPGMGKSSHAKTEALHVARHPGLGGGAVAVFTLEMGVDEYADRMRDEAEGFGAWEGLNERPVFLDDSARLTTTDVRAKLHRLTNELRAGGRSPLRLVVVDYLQLLQGRGDNREQEVASIARDLKIIAREFDVAVLALAQLSRACEQRSDKRPMLSDLRESGEIEQAADVVLFYYRPEMYGAEEVEGPDKMMTYANGVAEVIVGKHRGGPTGTVWARFDGPTTSFRDFNEPGPARPVAADTPF